MVARGDSEFDPGAKHRKSWNAGRKLGAKRALQPQQIWAVRFWLDRERRLRDRAMFDLAIDSKLRGCDIVKVKIGDIVRVVKYARARSSSSRGPAGQFSLPARGSILAWLERRDGTIDEFAFFEPDRSHRSYQHPAICSAR
jgi:hypothetical protein